MIYQQTNTAIAYAAWLVWSFTRPRMDGRLFVSYTTTKSDDDCGRAAMEASAGWCAILVVKELSPGEHAFMYVYSSC